MPAHALCFETLPHEMQRRVRQRLNHPGGVQGESGAKMSKATAAKFSPPQYAEGFALISAAYPETVAEVAALYGSLRPGKGTHLLPSSPAEAPPPQTTAGAFPLRDGTALPAAALGTMNLKKTNMAEVLGAGFAAVVNPEGFKPPAFHPEPGESPLPAQPPTSRRAGRSKKDPSCGSSFLH